jgi:hypothetical protein
MHYGLFANRGQNGKLQGAGGDTLLLAKLRHEIGELFKPQCCMMLDPPNLRAGGQELVEMTAPPLCTVAPAHSCPIEDGLDARPRSRLAVSGLAIQRAAAGL